jgi:uncharacterized protein (DUF1501 family)
MQLQRREILSIGGIWGMNYFLPDWFCARAQAKSPRGTFAQAKSVIVLYLHGGHAQQETWDPKPDAPYPARGEFGAIATAVPGIRVSELLPRSAQIMRHVAIIRSLSHGNANHVQASLAAMTGHAHPPSAEQRGDFPPSPSDFPPYGAVLDHVRPATRLPTWVQVGPVMRRNNGTLLHGQFPGFIGSKHGPLMIDQDLLPDQVQIDAVATNPEVPMLRLSERRRLQEQVDDQRRLVDQTAEVKRFDAFHQRALSLLTSPATARAFQLKAEAAEVRERYGRSQFGQCCLLARRLAEAGIPMINVHYCRTPAGSWDTHSQHFRQMKNSLCPTFDRAFASLVEDLAQRGLLGQTLVMALAEFGRTPQVNKSAGRDHWPWVYSIALAGGGVTPGIVYGASDKIAAQPASHPHDPRDLAATVYHLLGVPPDTLIHDLSGRPHALVIGQKIDGLVGGG